jgi:hypothetical protein
LSFDLGQFSKFDRKSTERKMVGERHNAMMENVMRKILTSTAIGMTMICLMCGTASAQLPAPIGHRQPSAETVPADDSVRGSTLSTEHRSVAGPTTKSKAANPFDDGMDFPNICSNCDQ